jgi:adenylyl cyclase-associated protein
LLGADIKGKCKAITVDGCEKVNVLFDTIVSCVETVNCKRLQMQARGMCPVVSIEKTDGCLVYLSKEVSE